MAAFARSISCPVLVCVSPQPSVFPRSPATVFSLHFESKTSQHIEPLQGKKVALTYKLFVSKKSFFIFVKIEISGEPRTSIGFY